MMVVIFFFSAQPSSRLPNFDWADQLVKKGGHAIGYAVLAWLYWHGLDYKDGRRWIAWSLAILYALTDEFHQSFVSGRHPTIWDVMIFDNLGALVSVGVVGSLRKQKRPDSLHPIAEEPHREL